MGLFPTATTIAFTISIAFTIAFTISRGATIAFRRRFRDVFSRPTQTAPGDQRLHGPERE